MYSEVLLVVTAVLASVLLGIVSNWIYDLVRRVGLFPERVNAKVVFRIALIILPLLCLVVLAEISSQERKSLWKLVQEAVPLSLSIPLWGAFLLGISACLLGYVLGRWDIEKRNADLERSQEEMRKLKEECENMRAINEEYLRSGQFRPKSKIINPER